MTDSNTIQRAVDFIKNFGQRGIAVKLKADGSVPATLTPPADGWDTVAIVDYLHQEVRMSNFQDAMRRKGHGSIYLTTAYAESVLHIRVLPGSLDFHYVD